jgi:ABC-type uncharacterized transport system YnjBCD ATPase subunit
MRFDSAEFLFFFVAVLLVHRTLRVTRAPLVLASYLFYASWNPPFLLLLFASTALDYTVALRLERSRDALRRRLLLGCSLAGNLGVLAYFKYVDFALDVVADSDAVRRRTALMTPLGHTYEELTGIENLRFAARMSGDSLPTPILVAALEGVGLDDVGELTVRAYSTGMRKRLELARIGLREPELVLLDEPFTSLDTPGVELMQDAIGRWRAAGTTVVIASHRIEEAARHADRTVRLAGGVITDAAESS